MLKSVFSNMTVTALFPVSPPTVDGSHDFLLFLILKYSDTNLVFQTGIFLILFVRNNKRSSGIDGKTSDCLSTISLYYRCLELRFFCSFSHMNILKKFGIFS